MAIQTGLRLPGIPNTGGTACEIKDYEYRTGVTPYGVRQLREHLDTYYFQRGMGDRCGYTDRQYRNAGGTPKKFGQDVWGNSQFVIQVKEPLDKPSFPQFEHLRPDMTFFSYIHPASSIDLARGVALSGVTGIAYETVIVDGRIPMLEPMSIIAGREAVRKAASFVSAMGTHGVMMSEQNVTIIGGGTVGSWAAVEASSVGADVVIYDINPKKPETILLNIANDPSIPNFTADTLGRIKIFQDSDQGKIKRLLNTDTLVFAALLPGDQAPLLIDEETFLMLAAKNPGMVMMDVPIDQRGSTPFSFATDQLKPTYIVDRNGTRHNYGDFSAKGIIMSCIPNIPGGQATTATRMLTATTLPYALKIAELGVEGAVRAHPELRRGINTFGGFLTVDALADKPGFSEFYRSLNDLLGQ